MTDNTLETMIDETITKYQQYAEEKHLKAEERKKQAEHEEEERLRQLLAEALTSEFLESITLSFIHVYNYAGEHHTSSAHFPYLGYDWHLINQSRGWTIYTTYPGREAHESTKATEVSTAHLQARLLIELGKHRDEKREREAKQRVYEQQQEERQRDYAVAERKREQERTERITKADAEHQRLSALVAQARAKAEQALWHWPEGVTIEVYKLEYLKGALRDDEADEASFDYDGGWTTVSHLDAHGRIQIGPMVRLPWHTHASGSRVVQLIPEVHYPVWTMHQYSSTKDLPEALRQDISFSIPSVVKRWNSDLDEHSRFIEVTEQGYDEEWYSETVGQEPLPWIKALVEQALMKKEEQ